MSDSDLIKCVGPASRGPECRSPPTPRMELLSPSKVKDRSQNVTEKVTQVRGGREPLGSVSGCTCWFIDSHDSQEGFGESEPV